MKIKSIDSHRNGISGEPFCIIKFTDDEYGEMIAFLFYDGCCAVLNYDLLKQDETRFFHNSWRGDNFYPSMQFAANYWKNQDFDDTIFPFDAPDI